MSNAFLGVAGHLCNGKISATGFERCINRYFRPFDNPRLTFGMLRRNSLVEIGIVFID